MLKNKTKIEKHVEEILESNYPVLNREKLKKYVISFFEKKNMYLNIVENHGSPLYLIEKAILKQRAMQFRNAFEKVLPDVAFYYAVKSNNHPEISKQLLLHKFGLDVSSGMELEMALSLGAQNIIFSGPGKTDKELLLATLNSKRVTVLIDSFGELKRLEKAAGIAGTVIHAGVRVTTDSKGLWRKFGISKNTLLSFWETSQRYRHIKLQGIQFHTSWNLTPEKQVLFIKELSEILSFCPLKYRKMIKFIDIGGGYWPNQGEWLQPGGTPSGQLKKHLGINFETGTTQFCLPAKPIEYFAEHIGNSIKKFIFPIVQCKICFEPGRWICNDAMHVLMTVVDKKAYDLVITDAGTNAIGWERFETDYAPLLNLSSPSVEEKKCLVLGSLCTPHDVWGYGYWGEEIEPSDILMVPSQGAYTYSLKQNFIKPVPDVVLI